MTTKQDASYESTDKILDQILFDYQHRNDSITLQHKQHTTLKIIHFLLLFNLSSFFFFLYYNDLNTQYQLAHNTLMPATPYALPSVCFFILSLLLLGFISGYTVAKRIIARSLIKEEH